jgi:hypothetical protein
MKSKISLIFVMSFFAQLCFGGACDIKIKNHGVVSASFYSEVLAVIKAMPDVYFAKNSNFDVYSFFADKLGPYSDLKFRRAVMAHVVASMPGQESDWNWTEGRDMAAHNTDLRTQEAGAWQTSCNIIDFDHTIGMLVANECSQYGTSLCSRFINCSKKNHHFAIETVVRALRAGGKTLGTSAVRHWGPLRRGELTPYLSRACVSEIAGKL